MEPEKNETKKADPQTSEVTLPEKKKQILVKLVEQLKNHMVTLDTSTSSEDGFAEEFQLVEKESGQEHFFGDHTSAKKLFNRTKNRYSNVLPYEKTRVILQSSGVIGSDYINANYISGEVPGTTHAYIATQGPLEATIVDFWRMVWDEKSSIVVMLTRLIENDRAKCHRYYPKQTEPIAIPGFKITLLNKELTQQHQGAHNLVTRKLQLENIDAKESRLIWHFQYAEWPDHGIPASTVAFRELLHLVDQVNGVEYKEKPPIVVHCSAGIGRTGTFCTVHYTLKELHYHLQTDTNPSFDISRLIIDTVLKLRKQRFGMVQTKEQYIFCYMCLEEALEEEIKKLGLNDTTPGNSENGRFDISSLGQKITRVSREKQQLKTDNHRNHNDGNISDEKDDEMVEEDDDDDEEDSMEDTKQPARGRKKPTPSLAKTGTASLLDAFSYSSYSSGSSPPGSSPYSTPPNLSPRNTPSPPLSVSHHHNNLPNAIEPSSASVSNNAP